MSPRYTIFLDDGGVMNDNALRGPQWQQFLGDYFVQRLGGTHEGWGRANHDTIVAMFDGGPWSHADISFEAWERQYSRDWLHGMTSRLGLPAPVDDDCVQFFRESGRLVTERVQSAIPGAADAIRELARRGYTLHCASGETTWELDGYLRAMGVREHVSLLYGADLAGWTKSSPEYYRRVIEGSRADPARALFVDDGAQPLSWASAHGVVTVHAGGGRDLPGFEPTHRIASLANLPALLERMEAESA